MIAEPRPRYDALRQQRLTCLIGIEGAERCLHEETLQAHHDGYARRLAQWRGMLEEIDRQLAAFPIAPVYPQPRTEEIKALYRAMRAKQVTPAEFGQRMKELLGHA